MGRSASTGWADFIKFGEVEDAELKKMHNKSHYNAWCKCCIENETTNAVNAGPFRTLTQTHAAMRIVKPVRGVNSDMLKHLQSCPHNPGPNNDIQEPTSSQPRPRQTILNVETVGNGQQVKSPQQVKEWQHDILHLFIAMEARFNAANHPEVNAFFMKYFGKANPSSWTLSNTLLREEVRTLDQDMAIGKEH